MPDSDPRYEKTPRPESIDYFITAVSGHSKVMKVETVSNILYRILRFDLPNIKVFLTNIYTVSLADVIEILGNNEGINTIITMSVWNSYTEEAKKYCISQNIGLFQFVEFMGALNFEGIKFIDYKVKKD
jgi:hypothetical protein